MNEADQTPGSPCPYCGKFNDSATGVLDEQARPSAGDISICFTCAGLCVYDETLALRKPTRERLVEIQRSSEWPMLCRISSTIRALKHGPANSRPTL